MQNPFSDGAGIVPLVLAGGAGRRLAPLSTPDRPKPFIPLLGEQTPFQATLRRLKALAAPAAVIAVQTRHLALAQEQAQAAGYTPRAWLAEPCLRNTAPALAVAAAWLQQHGATAAWWVVPSDHAIDGLAVLGAALDAAARLSACGHGVLFGIQPDAPETGYGYIEAGGEMAGGTAHHIARFVEKPDAPTARAMLHRGGYYWNSGMFLFDNNFLISAYGRHQPSMWQQAEYAARTMQHERAVWRLAKTAYAPMEAISIDYALLERETLEKEPALAMVPAAFDWCDLGTPDAVNRARATRGLEALAFGDVLA